MKFVVLVISLNVFSSIDPSPSLSVYHSFFVSVAFYPLVVLSHSGLEQLINCSEMVMFALALKIIVFPISANTACNYSLIHPSICS